MKKKFLLLMLSSLVIFAGCSNKEEGKNPQNISQIRGKFKNTTSLKVYYRRTPATDDRYLYTTIYPLTNISGFGCYEDQVGTPDYDTRAQAFGYSWNQTLILNKDYSYSYKYTVTFGNPWNCPEMMTIDCDIQGTYTYQKVTDDKFVVNISSPISGTENIYGCHFSTQELWWFGGGVTARHKDSDKEIDFELNRSINREEIDYFVRSRDFTIEFNRENPSENNVIDDLFYSYYLDYVGQFCTYQ